MFSWPGWPLPASSNWIFQNIKYLHKLGYKYDSCNFTTVKVHNFTVENKPVFFHNCLFKMLGVRVNSFNESSLGEPEQDANSALTELDKGK